MKHKRIIVAGMAAGVLGHILQGFAAFLLFDRFYLQNPDLVRDPGWAVAFYYLGIHMLLGVAIAYLAVILRRALNKPDWQAGMAAGFFIWAGSSPIFIIKRQIILRLSNWLLFEIGTDFIVYIIMGAVAGFLAGRGITERKES